MTTFRDRRGRPISADQFAAQVRREAMSEVRAAFADAEDLETVRDRLQTREPDALSFSDIAQMSEADVNGDWERVSRALARGPAAEPVEAEQEEQEQPSARRPTGIEIAGHTTAEPALTIAAIRKMSVEEITARQSEVDAALKAG